MPETIRDATCPACGCLCDDLSIRIEDGRIAAVEPDCPKARAWFQARAEPSTEPIARLDGIPAPAESALARAVEILARARRPLLIGLTACPMEAQARAVALADRLGAAIDPGDSAAAFPRLLAFQRVGRVSATLGEVRNRADVVVFWGADPATTHPRHLERYSLYPQGRFIPQGRAGRTLIVIDHDLATNATARLADVALTIAAEDQADALATLRALIVGANVPACDELRALASRLIAARYGAFFHGAGPDVAEAAHLLVRDLNRATRFVALSLGAPGNAAGAEAVLGWQAGAACAADFGAGFPAYRPCEAGAETILSAGQADAALILADDPADWLSTKARAHLARIPTIAIRSAPLDPPPTVQLTCATFGVETPGTVLRSDGVALPLRPLRESPHPTAEAWLDRLSDALGPRP